MQAARLAALLALLVPLAARAESITVTDPAQCFNKLSAAESLEIRRDFAQPWRECQRRVAEKEQADKTKQPTDKKEEKPKEPTGDGGYYRVQKPVPEKKP